MVVGFVGGATFWYKAGRHLSGIRKPVRTGREVLVHRMALGIAWALCLAIPGYVVTPIVDELWSWKHCATETRQRISDLSGFDFEMTATTCTARPTHVSVYGSPAGNREKVRLFEFVVGSGDDAPKISVNDPTHIVIAIPVVSSVRFQMHDWGNVHIEYRIERVIYQ